MFWKAARPFDMQTLSTFVPQKNFFVIPKRFKSEKQVFMKECGYHSGVISKEEEHKNLPRFFHFHLALTCHLMN